jgi:Putative zinc-finger
MTHPEELLAGYVDGTLSTEERAVVDAHLSACERCRREIADARVAISALQRLPEVPAPSDLGVRAMTELGSAGGDVRRAPPAPRWQRWAAPAVAAAALLLVATLVLPKIGGGDATSADGASASEAAAPTFGSGTSAPLELISEDYQPDTLGALASDAAAKLTSGAAGAQPEASGTGSAPARTAGPGAAARATACIQRAFEQVPGTQIRLIRAKFQGQPAYIGLYAESPGPGQPVDALTVRVASVEACQILHIAQVAT